jgi:hypothetical protein
MFSPPVPSVVRSRSKGVFRQVNAVVWEADWLAHSPRWPSHLAVPHAVQEARQGMPTLRTLAPVHDMGSTAHDRTAQAKDCANGW